MPADSTPRILQVDADAFYVQVARLTDPEGAGKAELLLVGGSPQGRGVVTSASYAARKFGVRSGMPTAQALRLCPGAMVVGVARKACSQKSRAIVGVLERFTPVVEPASIDEMYLDLTGTEKLYHGESLEATARKIRVAVLQDTEITVSIGGGTTRLVAKLAASRAKPHRTPAADGVIIVPPGEEAAFLTQFDLADIPGVGPRFQERLARLGLGSVRDALEYDLPALQQRLGERVGKWLYRRIRGVDPTPVERRPRAKSLSRDETFPRDINQDRELVRELLRLVDRATADLRRHGYVARTVSVKIRDHDFTTRQKSRTLPEPVISDGKVASVAKTLLSRLRAARRVPARLLGVSLSHLSRDDLVDQLELFEVPELPDRETERDRNLARAIDRVREKFGRDAVNRGF
ncbi:MAG: DNA polymerase IV [Gemmatimonadales bacterium]|nr:DNA polymerase IV [Gemmatimonadales bacterium]NIQ99199.1 DNA polymerase IV [Gemmatimonadales bacterium]NIS63972.1 DNA polymerase IV [Gemmatimonadales bacterium]